MVFFIRFINKSFDCLCLFNLFNSLINLTKERITMKKLLFLFIALSLAAFGCKDSSTDTEETEHHHGDQTLNVRFYPTWGANAFQMNTNYNTTNDVVKFTMAQFYVSEVSLIDSNGVAYPADGIKLINISTLNANGYVEASFLTDAEPGSYRGIKFSIGVPFEENHQDVSKQTEPLGPNSGMFWSWNYGYIFHALEGKFDSAGTSKDFVFHQGTDNMKSVIGLYSMEEPKTSFTLLHNTPSTFSVNLDYKKAFSKGLNTANEVNLKANPAERVSHGGVMAAQVNINLRDAFTRKN